MAFRPLLPYSGADGWTYLRDTLATQQAAHDAATPTLDQINLQYFRNNVGGATTAAQLVADGSMIETALKAFGLGRARPTAGFVEAALTADTRDEAAFLAKFKDARWLELSKAFGYGTQTGGKVGEAGFADQIVARHRIMGFEDSVQAADPSLRRVLAFDRAIQGIAAAGYEEIEGWKRALGDEASRRVLTGALKLGAGFEALDADAQAKAARDAYERLTGARKVDAFAASAARDTVIKLYFENQRSVATGSTRPSLSGSGMARWEALEASLALQQGRYDAATRNDSELRYFAKTVATATTAADLVADERLRTVALKAFGLGDAKPTAAFVQAVLESDTANPSSFANRQGDPRWAEMARAFGYGDGRGPQVEEYGFAEDIAARYRQRGFEEALGAADDDMRLALIFDRAIETMARQGYAADEGWARALGHPSVGWVLQQALDLPDDFAALRPSAQAAALKAAAKAATGSDRIDVFAGEAARDGMVRRFLAAEAAEDKRRPTGLGEPVIPVGGVAGWRFLQRTLADQQARFNDSIEVTRETRYFREAIGKVETAADLVKDRRLLAVALGAFGLEAETDKRFFIERALAEGTEDQSALAMRLVDPRYREMAAAFGFGDAKGAQTGIDGFAETVIARYQVRAFERAVGEQNEPLRLALYFDRQAESAAAQTMSDDTAWLRLLGDVPTRNVIEKALGLPSAFSQIAIETQLATVKTRVQGVTGSGTVKAFADAKNRNTFITRFLYRSEIEAGGGGFQRGAAALQLLQGSAPTSAASAILNVRA